MRANFPRSTKLALRSATALQGAEGKPNAVTTVTPPAKPADKASKASVTISNAPAPSQRAIDTARLGFARILEGDNVVLSGKQLLSFAIADYIVNTLKLSRDEVMRIARDYPSKGTSDDAKGNACALSSFRADMVRLFVLEGADRPSQKVSASADPVTIAKAQSAWRSFAMRQRSCGDATEIALCVLAVDGKLAQFDAKLGAWMLTNQQYVTTGVIADSPKQRAPMVRCPQAEWVQGIITVDGKDVPVIQARDANNFRRMVAQRFGFFTDELAAHYKAANAKATQAAIAATNNPGSRAAHHNAPSVAGGSVPAPTSTPAAGMVTPAGAGATPVQTANNGLVVTQGDMANPDRNTQSTLDKAKQDDWLVNMQAQNAAILAAVHATPRNVAKADRKVLVSVINKEKLTQAQWNAWLDNCSIAVAWMQAMGMKPEDLAPAHVAPKVSAPTIVDGVPLSVPAKADKPADSAAVEVKRAPRKVAQPKRKAA